MSAVDCWCEARADCDLKEALRTRISRERVGIELEKMLKGEWISLCFFASGKLIDSAAAPSGPDPHLSISLINSLSLYPHIFSVPATTILAPSSSTPALDVQPPPYCPAPHGFAESILAADILRAFINGPLSARIHPSLVSRVGTQHSEPSQAAAPDASAAQAVTPDVIVGGNGKSRHLWLACALVPCRGGMVKEKKKEISLMEAVIREGLKVSPAGP